MPALRVLLALALLSVTSPAVANPGAPATRVATPTARQRAGSLVRRSLAPVSGLVRRGLSGGSKLLRRSVEGRPLGQLVRRGVVRQVKHLFFVGALKRARQRSEFRAFVREVDRQGRQRVALRAEQAATTEQAAPSAQEPPSAIEIYGDHLKAEGTGRRRLKLFFGAALAYIGRQSLVTQPDSMLGLIIILGGAAIFVENNWWLSEKVDKAISGTLKELRDRGIELPPELGRWFHVKPKSPPKTDRPPAEATPSAEPTPPAEPTSPAA